MTHTYNPLLKEIKRAIEKAQAIYIRAKVKHTFNKLAFMQNPRFFRLFMGQELFERVQKKRKKLLNTSISESDKELAGARYFLAEELRSFATKLELEAQVLEKKK
ncbi:MAG: hypothetical protein KAT77_05750 [Nanoarchaeota archaeon]|nr:hypothetical protein [Nanoarchaeota archaeon]